MENPYIIKVTDKNIHIPDSYLYSKKQFKTVFSTLRDMYPDNTVLLNRTDCSMSREWATHNLLYNLHIARNRTKDVDLDYPQKWYYRLGYFIIGPLALLFIK